MKQQTTNQIQIGEIQLASSNMSMDDLISRAINIIDNSIIREYLSNLKCKKMIPGGDSYTG